MSFPSLPFRVLFKKYWPLWLGLGVLQLLPLATRPALIGGDEPHYALMAHSMAVDFDLDLEENYRAVEQGSKAAGRKRAGESLDRHLAPHGERQVFVHPLGLPALATPALVLLNLVAPGAAPDLVLMGMTLMLSFLGLLGGWWLLSGLMGSVREAGWVTFALYFSTPLWYYSRSFFTEPYLAAFLIFALVAWVRGRWILAALALATVLLIKEVALLLLLPVGLLLLIKKDYRSTAKFALGPLLAATVFVLKNLKIYGEPWVTFQPFQMGSLAEGLPGVLFDGQHGLLLFAPLVILALGGWLGVGRPPHWTLGLAWSAATVILFVLLTAAWIDWRGGYCYGPRLLVPILPFLAIPLAGIFQRVESSRIFKGAWILAAFLGFSIQFVAVNRPHEAMRSSSLVEFLAGNLGLALGGILVGGLALKGMDRQLMALEKEG